MKNLNIYLIALYIIIVTISIVVPIIEKNKKDKGYETYKGIVSGVNTSDLPNYYTDSVKYNVQKDIMINNLLNKGCNSYKIDDLRPHCIMYKLFWDELYISVKHVFPEIYVSDKEKWTYGAIYANGDMLMISSRRNIKEHMIAPSTYDRIKQYCLNLEYTQ